MSVRVKRLLGGVWLAVLLAGCATTSGNPNDPLEGYNRAMFSFNETLDDAVLKPVARGYRAVLPQPVRTGVTNFFSNIEDLWIGVNNVLQGKVADGVGDFARFVFNSTFGLFGLIDIASDAGLEKHNEDFGQTLGSWGVGSGPYLVLPVLGPSTLRDTGGLVLDLHYDAVTREDTARLRNSASTLRLIDRRANLLDATNLLEEASLDKYSFTRDAYLQRRRSQVYDGNPPRPKDEDEAPDEAPAKATLNQPSPALSEQGQGPLAGPATVMPTGSVEQNAGNNESSIPDQIAIQVKQP